MEQRLPKPVRQLLPILVLAGVTLAVWAAWLGWDQHRDVQPDGTTTGPYEAWQVIGLVLTLLAPVYWAASRRYIAGAVPGTTVGLTAAAYCDWSDDSSGLFMVGVGMVMVGSLVVTAVVFVVIASVKREGPPCGARRLPIEMRKTCSEGGGVSMAQPGADATGRHCQILWTDWTAR